MVVISRLLRWPLVLGLLCGSAFAGAIVDSTTEESYLVGEHPTLTVKNTDGRIYVYGSEPNQIRVKAYKRAFTTERLAKIAPQIAQAGDNVTINTSYPPVSTGLFADRSGTVEYTILVPQNCIVKLELSQGEIQLEGLRKTTAEARLSNGRISVRNCFAETHVTLESGGLDVSYTWWETTPFSFRAENIRGDIGIHLPPEAALRMDASTASGHIRTHLAEDEEKAEDVQTLQAAIGEGSATDFRLRTERGNIRIDRAY